MLGHRELTVQDYVGILKRRVWIILGSGLVFLALGVGVTRFLKPEYQSQTLVIVQQQKVPEEYVKPVITEDLNLRLTSMREQILSRSRLDPIIDRFGLFAGQNTSMDDRVELTRKAISIRTIAAGAYRTPGFYIGFKASDPRTAQQVCAEITSLFLSENLRAQEQSAIGTTEFLSQQLSEAKSNLDQQDAKLAEFERKYMGRLPGQEQSNLNTMQSLTSRLDAVNQSISRTEQEETLVAAVIAQQASVPGTSGPTGGTSLASLNTELRTLVAQKEDMEALYTPNHPDLIAVSRRIAELRKEINSAPSTETLDNSVVATGAGHKAESASSDAASFSTTDTPYLQRAKTHLRVVRQSLADQREEQARIAGQIRAYQRRIESSPAIEADFKQITRDHDTALEFYKSLLAKMNESSMATDLERRQQGEQFQVLDAANLPDGPSFPNRVVFAGGGFCAGVVIGLLITGLLEYKDKSIRSEQDILVFTKQPTLAVISFIQNLPQGGINRKRRWSLWDRHRALESANG